MHVSLRQSLSRGASILAALVFVGVLGVIALSLQAFSPLHNQQAQAAQAAATTPTEYKATKAPVSCWDAFQRAKNKTSDGVVESVDKGQAGTLDPCYGSLLLPGKTPSAVYRDYKCVGRKGAILIAGGEVKATTVPDPDPNSKPKICNIQVCENDYQHCSQAKAYSSGLSPSQVSSALPNPTSDASVPLNPGQIPSFPASPNAGSDALNDAFKVDCGPGYTYDDTGGTCLSNEVIGKTDGQTVNTSTMLENLAAQSKIDQQLSNCAFSDGGCDADTVRKLQQQKDALQVQLNPNLANSTSWQDVCANNPSLVGCSSPNGDTSSLYQGPCPSGEMDPATGKCSGTGVYQGPCQNGQVMNPNTGVCGSQDIYQGPCSTPGQVMDPATGVCRTPGQQCTGAFCYTTRTPYEVGRPAGGLGGALSQLFGGGGSGGRQSPSPFYRLGQMLGSLLSGNSSQNSCATNQDQYNQQLQQYQYQQQQYNYQLQQYNYQQYYGGYNSGSTMRPPPPQMPPSPCFNNSSPSQCMSSPPQPNSSGCTNGTWRSTTAGNGCVSGWQCVPGGAGAGTTPIAQLSCQPQVADVGMTLAISFACQNATASVGRGFDTGGQLSGSASTTIANPPGNTNTATYALTCTNLGVTAGAQCSVQVGKPSIVLIANPKQVKSGDASSIGWITSGMQTCVVSSPDMPAFTAQNANNTSVNGVATTSPITATVNILLHCTTLGGMTREATTSVGVL